MPTKQTPKSCSCSTCRFGKHTKGGKKSMKFDERSFRHNTKIIVNKGEEVVGFAPKGNYYD